MLEEEQASEELAPKDEKTAHIDAEDADDEGCRAGSLGCLSNECAEKEGEDWERMDQGHDGGGTSVLSISFGDLGAVAALQALRGADGGRQARRWMSAKPEKSVACRCCSEVAEDAGGGVGPSSVGGVCGRR